MSGALVFGFLLGGGWLLAGFVGYRWGRGDAETDSALRELARQLNHRSPR